MVDRLIISLLFLNTGINVCLMNVMDSYSIHCDKNLIFNIHHSNVRLFGHCHMQTPQGRVVSTQYILLKTFVYIIATERINT